MKLLRAILKLFSDLTESTTATANDWLAIQKSGETELKKIKPTGLPYLPSSGGTLAGNLSLSAASDSRALYIGTGRTSDGVSGLYLYATGYGNLSTSFQRDSGANGDFRIIQHVGTGAARLQVSVFRVRNMADNNFAAVQASAFNVNSDPRSKRGITAPAAVPSAQALGAAAIEFEWAKGQDRKRHLSFDAARIREIAPLASVEMLTDQETGEPEVGIDLAALLAIQARLIADLDARLSALERGNAKGPRE